MIRTWLILMLASGCAELPLAAASFRNVANGVWSTGASVQNGVDGKYVLIQLPTGCTGVACQEDLTPLNNFGPSVYVVNGPNGTFPLNGFWSGNDSGSVWVGPRADQTNPVTGGATFPNSEIFASSLTPYVYRTTFNLSLLGINPAQANIQLRWASDSGSGSEIRLCGIASLSSAVCGAGTAVAGSANNGPTGPLTPVSINSGFVAGLMALDFVIYNPPVGNGELNPSGLRVEIVSASTDPPPSTTVPEPGAFGLIGLGVAATILRRRWVAA